MILKYLILYQNLRRYVLSKNAAYCIMCSYKEWICRISCFVYKKFTINLYKTLLKISIYVDILIWYYLGCLNEFVFSKLIFVLLKNKIQRKEKRIGEKRKNED